MIQKLIEIIKYNSEGPSIDFKKEQYPIQRHPKKHEILKDFIAMVNHPSDDDKFIIIGVKEKGGVADKFFNIIELIDESKYQQYINSNIEPNINFEYNSFEYDNYQLAYFRLFNNTNRPYLIKKDVQNPSEQNRLEFKIGDGFIRIGTSTKKLSRKEFDEIYLKKYSKADRKNDIQIIPKLSFIERDEITGYPVKYFDVDIVNNSNKSIELDLEMTIDFNNKRTIVSESVFNEKLKEFQYQEIGYLGIPTPDLSGLLYPNLRINIEERDNSFFIERIKLKGENCAIRIPQKSIEKDAFFKEIYIIEKDPFTINGEIIIRSDDFPDGYLKHKIEYKVEA